MSTALLKDSSPPPKKKNQTVYYSVFDCCCCVDVLHTIHHQAMSEKRDVQRIFTNLHSIFLSILQISTSLNFCICPLSKHFLCQFVEI